MSIASEIERLQNAKSALKTAIEGKGVTVPSATKLDGYSALVDSISVGGDSGSEEMNCVYKEITAAGSRLGIGRYIEAPIKDKRVVVLAKNTSASYVYQLIIHQEVSVGVDWRYTFTIPTNGNVLIICDPETETASLYSYGGETRTIVYYTGGGGSSD